MKGYEGANMTVRPHHYQFLVLRPSLSVVSLGSRLRSDRRTLQLSHDA